MRVVACERARAAAARGQAAGWPGLAWCRRAHPRARLLTPCPTPPTPQVVPPLSGSKQLKMRYKPANDGPAGRGEDPSDPAKGETGRQRGPASRRRKAREDQRRCFLPHACMPAGMPPAPPSDARLPARLPLPLASPAALMVPSRHLWLGNITQKPTDDQVLDVFASFGKVDSGAWSTVLPHLRASHQAASRRRSAWLHACPRPCTRSWAGRACAHPLPARAQARLAPPLPTLAAPPFLRPPAVRVFPVKAYAFVNYSDIGSAIKAMQAVDGLAIPQLTGATRPVALSCAAQAACFAWSFDCCQQARAGLWCDSAPAGRRPLARSPRSHTQAPPPSSCRQA